MQVSASNMLPGKVKSITTGAVKAMIKASNVMLAINESVLPEIR
ncbi:hypothetical protein [Megalodesulfovibrio paquesii]